MTFDLAIIGGGPAGCAAAITAARNGARVVQLERGEFPRHRVCGEFVSSESLELLNELLGSQFAALMSSAPRISQASLFVDGRLVSAEIHPFAASISRFELDAALWKACLESGVEAHSESAVRSISGGGPFKLTVHGETFEAKSVINAAGRWSILTSPATRAWAGAEKWVGIKAHFIEKLESNSVDLYFFDGGYCGVQPIEISKSGGQRVNACAMVRADVASTMAHVLKQHPGLRLRSQSWTAATEPVTTSPLIFHQPEPVQGTMLQAGDAAMFVDPFVGDGISLALRSGRLAAENLLPFLRNEISLSQAAERYSREYLRRFQRVFTNSSRLRGLMRWPQMVRKPVLSVLARAPLVANQLVRLTR